MEFEKMQDIIAEVMNVPKGRYYTGHHICG